MADKSTIFLKKGWNLVSFYIKDISLESLVNNKNILEIKSLNKTYNSKLPINLNTLKTINIDTAYWINSISNTVVNIVGDINKKDINVSLKKGWNLLGYPFKLEQELITNDKISNVVMKMNSRYLEYSNTQNKSVTLE